MSPKIVDAYYNLANAIIETAATDYRNYKKKISCDWERMRDYERKLYTSKIEELEKFFLSAYGMFLSRGLCVLILEKLKKEVEGL